jgi:hypothetical protein
METAGDSRCRLAKQVARTAGVKEFAMFFRAEQLRRLDSPRRWLAWVAVGALVLGAVGCNSEPPQKAGGANTPKARENRKVAEVCVLESVQSAAQEQVATHPEVKRKNALVRAEERVEGWFGFAQSVGAAANSPPSRPVSPPSAPVKPPIVLQAPPPVVVAARSEPSHRYGPRRAGPVVFSEKVTTEIPYPSEAEAELRTVEQAQNLIERKLHELDPPVDYRPPVAVVRNEYLKRDSKLVRLPTENEKNAIAQAGYASDRQYVEYTVEVTENQVRELRTRARVVDALRGLGVLAAVSLAGFFFLRLDEWSKGYLTSWLALAAAALGGGIIAAVVFV